ncbi:hypothetical protein Nepgr_030908 [Nepenthes gracilis]|uniref:Uncharacterized protein n=1 Tax=Nepenthes gracilis TaxID=150966 RepID=A0AAD3TGB2_NEPGR|nr:hypothetical protein Nepgr_030908 [Nepenthes gracilis]
MMYRPTGQVLSVSHSILDQPNSNGKKPTGSQQEKDNDPVLIASNPFEALQSDDSSTPLMDNPDDSKVGDLQITGAVPKFPLPMLFGVAEVKDEEQVELGGPSYHDPHPVPSSDEEVSGEPTSTSHLKDDQTL